MRFMWMFLLLASAALCQEADRASLPGKWQIDPAKSDNGNAATLSIEIKDDDSLHYLLQTQNGETAEFQCTTDGQECAMTDGGRKARVSLWFNGPSLVIMETKGNNVVKRRLTVSGSTLGMEIIPIVPPGKTDKLTFNKQSLRRPRGHPSILTRRRPPACAQRPDGSIAPIRRRSHSAAGLRNTCA